jgi:hypothetical protein
MNNDTKIRISEDIPSIFEEITLLKSVRDAIVFNLLVVQIDRTEEINIFFDEVLKPDLSAKITKYLVEAFGLQTRHKLQITVAGIYTINVTDNKDFDQYIFGEEDVYKYKKTIR